MAIISDGGSTIQTWEIMITTIAAAATPYLAYKFRERRAKRPKTPHEALYEYYEEFIRLLQAEIGKKDLLIAALEKQYAEARQTIREQQKKLDESFDLIRQLKRDIASTHKVGVKMHADLQKTRDATPNIAEE